MEEAQVDLPRNGEVRESVSDSESLNKLMDTCDGKQ